jgi:hypothetical protein
MENRKKSPTFESLIEDLKFLIQQEKKEKQQHQKYLELFLSSFLSEIRPLYQEEKQRLLEKISLFRQDFSFLKGESVLERLKKDKETNHSKLLASIWKNPQIFCDFLQSIPKLSMDEQLKEWILEEDYQVEIEQEHIDILITDNQKRFCIAVENKINSTVSNHGTKLQLDTYYQYVNKVMPKTAVKYCLLLSHRNNKKYTLRNEWEYADYFCVFHSIKKNYSADNNILREYLMTVFSIVCPQKDIGENINEETSIIEMNRFDQKIITQIK